MLQPKPVTIKIRVGEREKSLTNLFQFSSTILDLFEEVVTIFFFGGVGEGKEEKDKRKSSGIVSALELKREQ